jgi:outer membrane protein assembly factor BamD (BamD/ComL family)
MLAPLMLALLAGCASGGMTVPWRTAESKKDPPKSDGVVLTGTYQTQWVIDPEMKKELDVAKALFDEKKYAEAEPLFHKLYQLDHQFFLTSPLKIFTDTNDDTALDSEETKKAKKDARDKNAKRKANPICEEALFLEGECQRLQKNYREAEFTYTKVLSDYPRSRFATRVCQGLFEIADYWLEPTRRQMDQYQEQIQGKRMFVFPAEFVHWGKDMPFLDAEGNAIQALNTIRLHDIKGPMGEKALLYLGTIHFFNKDYKEADFYFSQLYTEYPNSKDAAKALKQSVICKQLITGGPLYDSRGALESKKLLMTGMGAYPELAKDEAWIHNQLLSINVQLAEKDLKLAEFYQRTGHAGAAYFCYELVCRRYPNTSYSATAAKRKEELRVKVEQEQQKAPVAQPGVAESAPATNAPRLLPAMPSLMPPSR